MITADMYTKQTLKRDHVTTCLMTQLPVFSEYKRSNKIRTETRMWLTHWPRVKTSSSSWLKTCARVRLILMVWFIVSLSSSSLHMSEKLLSLCYPKRSLADLYLSSLPIITGYQSRNWDWGTEKLLLSTYCGRGVKRKYAGEDLRGGPSKLPFEKADFAQVVVDRNPGWRPPQPCPRPGRPFESHDNRLSPLFPNSDWPGISQ